MAHAAWALGALLAGGASLGAAPDAGPSPGFAWDVPQVVQEIEVSETFVTSGVPNRFHVVVSRADLMTLYRHFFQRFEAAGFHIPPREEQLRLGRGQVMLTGFDPATETSYSVILIPQSVGGTQVVLGEAYLSRVEPQQAAYAPVMPGGRDLVTSTSESGQTLTYRVDQTPEEVAAWYRKALEEAGYVGTPDGVYARKGEALRVVASTPKEGPGATVVITRIRMTP